MRKTRTTSSWRATLSGFLWLEGATSLILSFLWGALEVTRNRVRAAVAERAPHRGRVAVEDTLAWVSRLQPFILFGAVAAGWLLADGSHDLHVLHLYAAACGLRVGLSTWAVAYQVGVQAVRRVRRPWPVIVAVEVAEVGALSVSVSALGPWALPLASAASTVCRQTATLWFARRAYRDLPWLRPRAGRALGRRSMCGSARGLGAALRLGLSNLAGELDPALLLLLASLGERDPAAWRMAIVVYLLKPLIAAGFGWVRVFYLDFKLVERVALAPLRHRFEQLLWRVSWWTAAGSFVCAQVDRKLTTPRRVALSLLQQAGTADRPQRVVARVGRAHLLWFDGEGPGSAAAWVAAGGCVARIGDSGLCASGQEALRRLLELGALPPVILSAVEERALPPHELARRFMARFPDGLVLDDAAGAARLPPVLARRLLAALQYGGFGQGGQLRLEGLWVRVHAPAGPILLRPLGRHRLNETQGADGRPDPRPALCGGRRRR